MEIKVETVYSNDWRGNEDTQGMSLEQLQEYAQGKFEQMKASLLSTGDIQITSDNIYPVIWDDFEQVRTKFVVKKEGSTKTTAKDIYSIINNIEVSSFN
jgi:hypothetical protein